MRVGLTIALMIAAYSWGGMVSVTNSPGVALLRVPNGGIQPQIAEDRGVLHLLYFSGEPGGGNLFYVRSTDRGKTFSKPLRVNSQNGSAVALGTIRGGHLAIGSQGRVHVTWNGSVATTTRAPDPAAQMKAPFLYSRSNATGTGFEPQRNLIHDGYALDGGGSIAADERGNVYAAWHAMRNGSPADEDHRVVWIAHSADEGTTFAPERAAAQSTGVCGCCGLTLLATPSRALFLLYRSATAAVHRDMYLLESKDGGESFRGSRVQGWELNACPMTSASLAASGDRVLAAWETAGQVFYGDVDTAEARVSSPTAAPGSTGTRKHPRLAVNAKGDTLLVWAEGTAWARGGSVAWQLFDRTGQAIGEAGHAPDLPAWSFATPLARPDGTFAILY